MTWYAGPVATCRFRPGRLPKSHVYPNVWAHGVSGLCRFWPGFSRCACQRVWRGCPQWPCASWLCLACPRRRATWCPGLAGLFRSCMPSPPAPIAVLCLLCPSVAAWVLVLGQGPKTSWHSGPPASKPSSSTFSLHLSPIRYLEPALYVINTYALSYLLVDFLSSRDWILASRRANSTGLVS
jgi:hypothetical protein